MLAKSMIFLLLAFFARAAQAGEVITFSPALPKPWVQITSQAIAGTNAISQESILGHITVIQNSTNLQSMMISVIPVPRADANNSVETDARNWVQGVLDGFGEPHQSELLKSS